MEFSWTTFFLEIINFIVLVWILQHFLYSPIKKAILARKAAIEKTVQDAEQKQKEAKALQEKYENRLRDWEAEKAESQKKFDQQMNEEKTNQLDKLQIQLKKEEQKFLVTEQKELADYLARRDNEALHQGIKFAAKFLTRLADANLQNKIVQLFLEDLSSLSQDKISALKKEFENNDIKGKVVTALALSEQQQNIIREKFETLFGAKVAFTFLVNSDLLAGIKILIGSLVLDADLCDELKFFTEVSSD
jgi:F-type H+-transporting ATPase subunit b